MQRVVYTLVVSGNDPVVCIGSDAARIASAFLEYPDFVERKIKRVTVSDDTYPDLIRAYLLYGYSVRSV